MGRVVRKVAGLAKRAASLLFHGENPIFAMPAELKKKETERERNKRKKGKREKTKSVGMYVTCIIAEQRHARHFFPPARSWRYIRTHTHTHTHIEALETIELAGWRVLLARRFSRWKRARMVDGEYSRYTTYWQYRRIGYWHRGKCNFRHEHWIGGSRFYPEARGSRGHARLSVSPVRISSIGTHIFCRSERTLAACRFHFPYIPR